MTDTPDRPGKRLTVHNASVTTMAIEVKTLMIGARQVTQGIFRQLSEEPLIAKDGTLNGIPWGRVNYCPGGKNCGVYNIRSYGGGFEDRFDTEHMHIVWQQCANLYRSFVHSAHAESRRFQIYRELGFHGIRACAWEGYSEDVQERQRDVRAALAQLPQLFIGG